MIRLILPIPAKSSFFGLERRVLHVKASTFNFQTIRMVSSLILCTYIRKTYVVVKTTFRASKFSQTKFPDDLHRFSVDTIYILHYIHAYIYT